MNLDQIPLFAMLKSKLDYTNQRQKLIAQNVANADTPNYAPIDLKPFSFEAALAAPAQAGGIATARTNAAHLSGKTRPAKSVWKSEVQPDSETRLDGNEVVLEDQMIKMNEARLDYDTAVSLYQKSLSLIRTAARKPGA